MSYPGAPPYGYQDRPRGGYGPRRGNHHGPPSNYRGPPHGHQPPAQHHQRPSGGQGQEMFGVFVGDLPPEADEQDLELLFSVTLFFPERKKVGTFFVEQKSFFFLLFYFFRQP